VAAHPCPAPGLSGRTGYPEDKAGPRPRSGWTARGKRRILLLRPCVSRCREWASHTGRAWVIQGGTGRSPGKTCSRRRPRGGKSQRRKAHTRPRPFGLDRWSRAPTRTGCTWRQGKPPMRCCTFLERIESMFHLFPGRSQTSPGDTPCTGDLLPPFGKFLFHTAHTRPGPWASCETFPAHTSCKMTPPRAPSTRRRGIGRMSPEWSVPIARERFQGRTPGNLWRPDDPERRLARRGCTRPAPPVTENCPDHTRGMWQNQTDSAMCRAGRRDIL
jgi:hypothetical protein